MTSRFEQSSLAPPSTSLRHLMLRFSFNFSTQLDTRERNNTLKKPLGTWTPASVSDLSSWSKSLGLQSVQRFSLWAHLWNIWVLNASFIKCRVTPLFLPLIYTCILNLLPAWLFRIVTALVNSHQNRPLNWSPLFTDLVLAAREHKLCWLRKEKQHITIEWGTEKDSVPRAALVHACRLFSFRQCSTCCLRSSTHHRCLCVSARNPQSYGFRKRLERKSMWAETGEHSRHKRSIELMSEEEEKKWKIHVNRKSRRAQSTKCESNSLR